MTRPATYRRTNQLTVPRSVVTSSARYARAAAFADRCDGNVPSWRGRCLLVVVSKEGNRRQHHTGPIGWTPTSPGSEGKRYNLGHLRSAFGGMGSFSELVLHPMNGHRLGYYTATDGRLFANTASGGVTAGRSFSLGGAVIVNKSA